MHHSVSSSARRTRRRASWFAGLAAAGLIAASCSSDKAAAPAETAAATTLAPVATEPADTAAADTTPADTAAADTTPADTAAPDTAPADTTPADPSSAFPDLGPATGKPIVVGLVNSEGSPGLDFPDIRIYAQASADYLNQHGGYGGRPIQFEHCAVKGSPETSQQCAQELAGKGVELVMLGLDLFPDYATYEAANIPVIGVLPILPGDYTAKALFLTGGNATTTAIMTAVIKDHFKATTVGIVSADNPGANGTEAALVASLDVAGVAHITVKGGDNETDAGYQGLMREAAKDNPDVLVSLYADAGCIGTIRGRAALGITIPVITTSICADKDVIAQVGDDALGWNFVGIQTQKDTPELHIVQEALAPAIGVAPEEVDATALGLGGLGMIQTFSLAYYADLMAADGQDVTGQSLYDYLGSTKGLTIWPNGAEIACGSSEKYPTICSFTFPVAEYVAGGSVATVEGLEAVSGLAYLP